MASASDEVLTALWREESCPESQVELFRRHRGMLLARARAAGADAHHAEDLASEALMRTFGQLAQGSEIRSFAAYATRTLRNLIIDQTRKGSPILADGLLEDTTAECFEYFHEVDRIHVHEVLSHLAPRQAQMLVLLYLCDLTASEAAGFMGLSPNAGAQLALRARRAFRDRYLESLVEPVVS